MASAALSTKAVGSKVQLKLNGVKKNFIVVHQGKPSGIFALVPVPASKYASFAPSTGK